MPIHTESFTAFAVILLRALPPEGMPEFAVSLSYEKCGLGNFAEGREVVRHLVLDGLLARTPGPRIVPGPEFEATRAEMEKARQSSMSHGIS
jgi:hypothetical protein